MKKILSAVLIFATLIGMACLANLIHEVGSSPAVNITLYGSFDKGWGLTSGSINGPGPTITVNQNDNINLTLISNDSGITHKFFVSYDNTTTPTASDPQSPDFTTTVTIHFIANVTGTFKYYCLFHPDVMKGIFIVKSGVPEFSNDAIILFLVATTLVAIMLVKKRNRHDKKQLR